MKKLNKSIINCYNSTKPVLSKLLKGNDSDKLRMRAVVTIENHKNTTSQTSKAGDNQMYGQSGSHVENTLEGSGVGLYIVNGIVINSGGKIVLKIKLGQGAEFLVYLAGQ